MGCGIAFEIAVLFVLARVGLRPRHSAKALRATHSSIPQGVPAFNV
jgi:hypothetical protein